MLILERCVRESLKIGEDIEVKLLGIRDGKARIGITCPDRVKVYREEVWKRLVRDKSKAS